jgi:hypothetical protein
MQVYRNQVLDAKGRPVPGAQVEVYRAGTSSLATVYSDHGENALTQPLRTGKDGWYEFKAAPGGYSISASKDNWSSQPIPIVLSLPQDGVYNVRDYGAMGDGVTDDSDAVQECITDSGISGTVFFPSGVYYMGLAVLNTSPACREIALVGSTSGPGATIKWDMRPEGDPLYFGVDFDKGHTKHVKFKNLKFQNGNIFVGNPNYFPLEHFEMSGCEMWTDDPSTVHDDRKLVWVPYPSGTYQFRFESCYFHDTIGEGLVMQLPNAGSARGVFHDCMFENMGRGQGGNYTNSSILVSPVDFTSRGDYSVEVSHCDFRVSDYYTDESTEAPPVYIGYGESASIVSCNATWIGSDENRAYAPQHALRFRDMGRVQIDGGTYTDIGCASVAQDVDEISISSSTRITPGSSGSLNYLLGADTIVGGSSGVGWTGASRFDSNMPDVNIFPDGTFNHWLHLPSPISTNVSLARDKTNNQTGLNAVKITPASEGAIDTTLTCQIGDSVSLSMLNNGSSPTAYASILYYAHGITGLGTVFGLQPIYSSGPGVVEWTNPLEIYEDTWVMLALESPLADAITGLKLYFRLCSGAGSPVAFGDYILLDAVYVGNKALRVTSATHPGALDSMVQAHGLGAPHGSKWAEYGSAGPGGLSSLNSYEIGDVLYLASPSSSLGHVCLSGGAGGTATWGTFGAIT